MTIVMTGCDPEAWGLIPDFLSEDNPEPAAKQFNHNYQSGWSPFKGFKLNAATLVLTYPGDPPMEPMGEMQFRDEMILLYPSAWVLILQKDGTWEVARMD